MEEDRKAEENGDPTAQQQPQTQVEVVVEMVAKAEPEAAEDHTQECEEIVEPETCENGSEYDSELEEEENGAPLSRSERSGSDTEGSVILEREEGDGQESAPAKKIDDDEDKKNPQYIPKRGTFYEHDDRTADDVEEETEEDKEKAEKEGKKKIWTEKKEKWSHDKFNDNDQAPKSRAELIGIYGYDIRNEEGPPRARRRRRYGRGPNKYTRNWEDEDAYNKPPAAVIKKAANPRKPRPGNQQNNLNEQQPQREVEEPTSGRQSSDSQNERTSEQSNQSNTQAVPAKREQPPPPKQNPAHNEQHQPHHQQPHHQQPQHHQQQQQQQQRHYSNNNNKNQSRAGSGRMAKPAPPPGREIKDSDYRGFTKPRQFAPKNTQNIRGDREIKTQNFTNKRNQGHQESLEKEMGKLSVQEQGYSKAKHGRQGAVPPRMQGEQKGSKRYSSIRQRTLPESTPQQPFNQQHNYYVNAEYTQQGPTQQVPPPQPLLAHPAPPQMPTIPPPPLPALTQQVPVTTTPLPPQFAPAFAQAPPPFLQAPPQPFIPQQTAPIINFVQPQPPYQQPYQGFQQQFNPVSQPTEIFQPPGGITYYSAQDQVGQRAAPQKRPKAAIPIVPPPPEPRGRGRSNQENSGPNAGEAEGKGEPAGGSFEDSAAVVVQQ